MKKLSKLCPFDMGGYLFLKVFGINELIENSQILLYYFK